MPDEAPVSSRHVRVQLFKLADVPERELDRIPIITKVTRTDRAVTIVGRPMTTRPDDQDLWDKQIMFVLRELEGSDRLVMMSMGREFTVEWAGVCRPI
jgi:hypothetical protein